jgi:hypothetical protein
MPKLAVAFVFAATAIIIVIAALVLGNAGQPAFALRPNLLVGFVVAAGGGLVVGLALIEHTLRAA